MRSFKTKININNKQKTKFLQHAGVSRHAYNWGLSLCIDRLKNKEKTLSAIDLHKLLVRDVKPKNNWYYDCSKFSPQQALINLENALRKFWKQHKINKVSNEQIISASKECYTINQLSIKLGIQNGRNHERIKRVLKELLFLN
jgi:hypothetical protein